MTWDDAFWDRVDVTDGCWLWTGTRQSAGYGMVSHEGRAVLAHRRAYELAVGPIPEGLELDHVRARGCTNRHCVNPSHLETVTRRENFLRGSHSAAVTHRTGVCKHGHRGISGRCRQCEHERNTRKDTAIVCTFCGETAYQRKDHAARPGLKFCSLQCFGAYRSAAI